VVDNLSLRSQRRVELRLELDLKTNATQINGLLEGIQKILAQSKILQQSVLLTDISADAYLVICEFYTDTIAINEFNELKQSVNLKVIGLMEELGIEIAGAGKDIRVRK
jgi:MscS family membrane protein